MTFAIRESRFARVLHRVRALYYTIYIVVGMTMMNMAEYGIQWSEQPQNVNFEPIIRGLNSDIFD